MTLEHIRAEKRSLNLNNDDKRTGDLKTTCNLTSGKFFLRRLMTFFLILILYVPKYGRQKVIDVFLPSDFTSNLLLRTVFLLMSIDVGYLFTCFVSGVIR